ncbi:Membrane-bound lytic murein transglycosylase F [subsurface metagenome]
MPVTHLFREAEINNLPGLRRIFIRLQGARREHNGLCDRRATQKPDKKTIKMGKLFIANSLRWSVLGMQLFVTCVLLVLCNTGVSNAGSIYSFVDERGVWHFSNVSTDPRYGLVSRSRHISPHVPRNYAVFEKIISKAATRHGLDPDLIRAIIQIESGGIPDALSSKGAIGLMQLMPETSLNLAVSNPFDPKANIWGGTKYLSQLLERFRGNLVLTLAAYNAGPEKVEKYGGIPPYPETRRYVRNVLNQWQKYRSD